MKYMNQTLKFFKEEPSEFIYYLNGLIELMFINLLFRLLYSIFFFNFYFAH